MIKVLAMEEVKSNSKELANKEFEKLKEDILKNYKAKLNFVDVEENELYTVVGEFEIEFDNFLEYIEFCLKYSPDVEVLKPSKIVLDKEELNKVLAFVIHTFKEFTNKYKIGFNVYLKDKKDYDIEKYKNGLYDDEELYELEEEYIRVKAVFEGEGKSEKEVVANLLSSLDMDNIIVNKILTQNYEKDEFKGLIGVDLFCKPFELFEIAYKYQPVALSVQKDKITLSLSEIQDIGNELGGAIFELSHAVVNRFGNIK
ncbi:hypothetical protein ACPB8Q_07700 [Methanocaldococcus indicus]|uniref:hypothetical protein n=1 Tax=Methanocaldococcus indicus TaxID=213231 RepID=UPI003C6D221C